MSEAIPTQDPDRCHCGHLNASCDRDDVAPAPTQLPKGHGLDIDHPTHRPTQLPEGRREFTCPTCEAVSTWTLADGRWQGDMKVAQFCCVQRFADALDAEPEGTAEGQGDEALLAEIYEVLHGVNFHGGAAGGRMWAQAELVALVQREKNAAVTGAATRVQDHYSVAQLSPMDRGALIAEVFSQ